MSTLTVERADSPVVPGENGWPAQGQWRYEDYLRLPDDERRYEIIRGVLYVVNAPSIEHQFAVMKLSGRLDLFVSDKGLGMVLAAPVEVHLSEETRPVQPDILFVRGENQPVAGAKFFDGVPDLIVEVISPSSIRTDRKVKYDTYEQHGVPEYWLVDPKTRSVEVHTLSNGEYALLGQYIHDEVVTSQVLAGLEIMASSLFLPTQ